VTTGRSPRPRGVWSSGMGGACRMGGAGAAAAATAGAADGR